ncbi:MAG: SDR family NAD(P)-dependent oxidoreductase [Thalassospira sp.]|nr:SDR family NAD(P)-dependent oxidoreductase [Thalassospira sp.]MBO6577781.1 SDR family NAD(P)-dependent oxidoreductase [Thalassospira sp.]MBO6804441.1 SDR family NAD(P)-dependent oxidoreductase [Thalassospira sp.]MBO6818523.1 SDR family NAD(P)-dependent oxidoreductase [Thalassospira sp.]MBO6888449.1 SDR family NAD(P)-dependent oxidoreductase [Thalassospira sp.]
MNRESGTVLITGATSGIGRELLGIYHAQGFNVIAHGRSEVKLHDLKDHYPGVQTVCADLAHPASVDAMMADILRDVPRLDLVINNAAVQERGVLTDVEFSASLADREIAINLQAPIRICHAVIKGWTEQGHTGTSQRTGVWSRIVNVSSGLAFFPKTGSAIYCASKAALHSFSQSLRYQLVAADLPIAISEVFLPVVDTPMTASRDIAKIPAQQAALAIHDGILAGQDEIYVGKARLIPVVTRLSPSLMKSILRKG